MDECEHELTTALDSESICSWCLDDAFIVTNEDYPDTIHVDYMGECL